MTKPIRHLINSDGAPFAADDMDALVAELGALNDNQRKNFRDENATAIASHDAPAILIVAGPGTGKSTLFKQRVVHWLNSQLPLCPMTLCAGFAHFVPAPE